VTCNKIELNGKTVELKELSEFNLSHYSHVEIAEGLDLRIKTLSVLMKLVHVFVFELVSVFRVKLNFIQLRVLFAQVILFKVNHY
jgi:hypothetical protein